MKFTLGVSELIGLSTAQRLGDGRDHILESEEVPEVLQCRVFPRVNDGVFP